MIYELPNTARYSLDTNCVVTAWRNNYPPTMPVFRPIWLHLEKLIDDGIVVATNVVWKELTRKDDEVLNWCEARDHMFIDLLPEIGETVKEIERDFPKLLKANRNEADPFVIAVAELRRPHLKVVTQEQLGTANENRPNIPLICNHRNTPYCSFLQMLTETGL